MSQEIMGKETKKDDELLKINPVQFRYSKKEMILENTEGCWIEKNPSCIEINYAPYREKRESKIYKNEDYHIYELKDLLKNPTIESSLKIWNTLSKASHEKLFAIYIPNEAFKKKYGKSLTYHSVFQSRIIHLLKEYKWIPDQEGNFHNPSEPDFYPESVHGDFKRDNRNRWLDEIGLMPGKKKQRELREETAKTLGFTMEEVELFTKYKEIKKLESKNL